ncbi:MAG: histidine--tRNA ligase [Eubacteriales bacterium]|nr:histidine--tRNA ligase [Eubacteriales bacterium]
MAKQKPRTLSGFMELLPAPQQQMERIMEILRNTYSLYGFTPLDTPIIESAEVLLAKGGGETEKQIYRFQKGDSDLALRFDLTVPLAKYVALHYGELQFPFRRYQIGKVYRGERAQRGRFREFYQADIDIIGDGKLDIINEAEIPSIIYRTFSQLGLKRFQIRVNNRKILNGFYSMVGLADKSQDVMRTVDKLDKIGAEKVKTLLMEDIGVAEDVANQVLDFIAIGGSNQEVLAALEGYQGKDELFDTGLEELSTVVRYLSAFGVPEENFAVDLTIARGLDYYTGTVYETTMLDHPEIGSVCSGGRYDNLAEYYTDKQLPGVGISIGLTRLFYVLGEQGMLNPDLPTAAADVLVIPMGEEQQGYAIATATALRQAGIRTQLYAEKKKFKARITYAAKMGIPYAMFLGETEEQDKVVALKDLNKGEQVTVSFEEAVKLIQDGIAQANQGTVIKEN